MRDGGFNNPTLILGERAAESNGSTASNGNERAGNGTAFMRGVRSVSAHLQERYSVHILPGKKGTCPFCRRDTFSVTRSDTYGRCWHPACSRTATEGSASVGYAGSLFEVLDKVKEACHAYLLANQDGPAYRYLLQRGVHPDVIGDLVELGAVPPSYNVADAFLPAFQALDAHEAELKLADGEEPPQTKRRGQSPEAKARADKRAQLQEARRRLQEQQGKLVERFASAAGWLTFFHTDGQHRVRSIRFRKPGEKVFQSFAPFGHRTGLFGHALFVPYKGDGNQAKNRLMPVEGEFNLLVAQSAFVRAAQPGEGGRHYANWFASTGSSCAIDVTTIKELMAQPGVQPLPVVIQDHDKAGDSMVAALADAMAVEVAKPPVPGQDLDDLVRSHGTDYAAAVAAMQMLVVGRRRRCRPFAAVAQEVAEVRQKRGKDDHRREHEVNAGVQELIVRDLCSRGTFYNEVGHGYYFHAEDRRLVTLDDSDKELSLLLARYGLNATERTHAHICEALHVESLTNGTPTHVHALCHYDQGMNTLYLSDHAGGIYRIAADGVEHVDNGTDGVLFLRDRKSTPFTLVEAEARDDLLRSEMIDKINFDPNAGGLSIEDQQGIMEQAFLAMFFDLLLPTRPINALIGPKGSGKTMSLRQMGHLLYGPQFEVGGLPSKEEDFDAVVTNTHFAVFDNADSRVAWLPDRLAICATGGTVTKRRLYTTNTLENFRIRAHVALTARTPHFGRDDVADRLLVYHVRRIEEGQFQAERELLDTVLQQRDRILTSVVQRLQRVLRALRDTAGKAYKTGFRLADFAVFVLRQADAEGRLDDAEALFDRMRGAQATFSLEGDRLVELLLLWVEYGANQGKVTTAAELHKELKELAEAQRLEFRYASGLSVGKRLANILPELARVLKVESAKDGHKNRATYRFWPLPEAETAPF